MHTHGLVRPFIALVMLSATITGCGNKAPIEKKAPPKVADAKAFTPTNECASAQSCPQLNLALSGITTLGGSAETLMTWDVGGTAPEDSRNRTVMVVMETQLPGMQVISKPTDPRVSVNWKPEVAQSGTMQFRARDVTRCQKVSGGAVNCGDMAVLQPQYEQILPSPFQVVAKNEKFDAGNSEFFRQFHCTAQGMTKADNAILAGAGVAVQVAGQAASSDNNQYRYGNNQSQGGIQNGVATIVDYLFNGDVVPTAYQCLNQKAAADKQAPISEGTLQQ
jgi:predicted small lipoprotein YifL